MSYRPGAPRSRMTTPAPAASGRGRDLPARPPRRAEVLTTLGDGEGWVPTVDYSDVPRIRIYDPNDPTGGYWYRAAGFTSKITDP